MWQKEKKMVLSRSLERVMSVKVIFIGKSKKDELDCSYL